VQLFKKKFTGQKTGVGARTAGAPFSTVSIFIHISIFIFIFYLHLYLVLPLSTRRFSIPITEGFVFGKPTVFQSGRIKRRREM